MEERDPHFLEKAVEIIELLLDPPTDGPLFCVDEKPGIGVREPTAPDQPPAPKRPARREFEYVRHGTVDLLAAFRVSDGQVTGIVRAQHRSREFCALLDPPQADPPRPDAAPDSGPGQFASLGRAGGLGRLPPLAAVRLPLPAGPQLLAELH